MNSSSFELFNSHELLNDWLAKKYLKESFHPGFERVKEVFNPYVILFRKKKIKIITVAGTNGKGEVSHRIKNQLRDKGLKVCMWNSPHVLSPVERFFLQDKFVCPKRLLSTFFQCQNELQRNNHRLSFYEFLFYCFCSLVLEEDPDVIILEVGLGGRLDAVNVFDANLTCLTNISRDHTEFLGESYREILREKLGVVRPGVALLSCLEQKYLRQITAKFCKDLKSAHLDMFDWNCDITRLNYSERNQLLATWAVSCFLNPETRLEDIKIESSWTDANLGNLGKGRWEKVTIGARSFIFIGAHNPDGIRKLVRRVVGGGTECQHDEKYAVWVGLSQRDKDDCGQILKSLRCVSKGQINLIPFDHPRAASKKLLKDVSQNMSDDVRMVHDLVEEVKRTESENNLVLVTGSYYFVGEVQKTLLRLYPDHTSNLLP